MLNKTRIHTNVPVFVLRCSSVKIKQHGTGDQGRLEIIYASFVSILCSGFHSALVNILGVITYLKRFKGLRTIINLHCYQVTKSESLMASSKKQLWCILTDNDLLSVRVAWVHLHSVVPHWNNQQLLNFKQISAEVTLSDVRALH